MAYKLVRNDPAQPGRAVHDDDRVGKQHVGRVLDWIGVRISIVGNVSRDHGDADGVCYGHCDCHRQRCLDVDQQNREEATRCRRGAWGNL